MMSNKNGGRRGRPREFNQHMLNFWVFAERIKAELTEALGRVPTDTQILQTMQSLGGYQQWVAGEWKKIKLAQANPKIEKSIASLRKGRAAVRAKAVTYLKTLQNYYGSTKQLAVEDPTFLPFARTILAQYGVGEAPQPDRTVWSVAWRPSLRVWAN